MTPHDLRIARVTLGLTQAQLAVELGVQRNAVGCWERGINPVPLMAERLITRLVAEAAGKETP